MAIDETVKKGPIGRVLATVDEKTGMALTFKVGCNTIVGVGMGIAQAYTPGFTLAYQATINFIGNANAMPQRRGAARWVAETTFYTGVSLGVSALTKTYASPYVISAMDAIDNVF